MLSEKSTLKQLLQNPIGADLINALIIQTGLPKALIENPVSLNLPVSVIGRLMGDDLVKALLKLVNSEQARCVKAAGEIQPAWWKEAVFYQIYPRSFKDASGDGIGDIKGIIEKLPYLKSLGITALWLSPVYDSPNDDNGYDIRNYKKIMSEFGTMKDFDALLKAVHQNGMRLIMDLVVNHTSDEHKWFCAAKKGDEEKAGYYIWHDGDESTLPNNWLSFFSGSVWEYCKERRQWYLHLFSKKQPDLNWENAKLRSEIYEMMNYWYGKGIDGFRMDVINFISKGGYENGNEVLGKACGYRGIEHYFYGPRLHEYLAEMRRETAADKDVFTVGETPAVGMEMCRLLTDESRGELDMVFNFEHFECPGKHRFQEYKYDLNYLKSYLIKWQTALGTSCRQALVLENHDNPRMTSKVNQSTALMPVLSKLLACIMFTMRGTPFVFQGQELGLGNVAFKSIDEMRDVESINMYKELLKTKTPKEAFNIVLSGSRDHARAPMPWDNTENGGFTQGTPWLRTHDKLEQISVQAQENDENSVLNYYKKIIALHKSEKAILYGEINPVFEKRKNLFCYFCSYKGEKLYVECNLSDKYIQRPTPIRQNQQLLLSNYPFQVSDLKPYEANIYKI